MTVTESPRTSPTGDRVMRQPRSLLGKLPGPVRTPAEAQALERDPFETYMPARSTYDALHRSASAFPGKLAYRFLSDERAETLARDFTYTELLTAVNQAGNLLRAEGVGRTDAVMFLAPHTPETFIAFLAAQAVAIAMPANPFLARESLEAIARAGRAVAVVVGPPGGDSFEKGLELLRSDCGIRLLFVADGEGPGASSLGAAWRSHPGNLLTGAAPVADDIAAYFHTGGTTGTPKLAKLSHRNLLFGAWATGVLHGLGPDEVIPNGMPLFHVGGGLICTFRTIMLGQTLVQLTPGGYRSPAVLEHFWELAARHGFTQLIAVPTTYLDLYRLRPEPYDGSLRSFVTSAAALSPELGRLWRSAFGADIAEGYGMTECSGFATGSSVHAPARPGSAGFALPFVEVRVGRLDSAGRCTQTCPPGESGEILVRSPGVFQGYLSENDTSAKFATDSEGRDWLVSGDIGYLDADGWLHVTGRAKDLIIRGGHNVDPQPIDVALEAHETVAAAATVGMPDPRLGEIPVAYVQLHPGQSVGGPELRAHCLARIPDRAGCPAEIFILPRLPTTAIGKIFKPELRRLAALTAVERAVQEALGPELKARVESEPQGGDGWRVRVRAPLGRPEVLPRLRAAVGLLNIPHVIDESAT